MESTTFRPARSPQLFRRHPAGSIADGGRGGLLRFAACESGSVAMEYVLVASLVSVAILVGVLAFSGQLNVLFDDLPTHF